MACSWKVSIWPRPCRTRRSINWSCSPQQEFTAAQIRKLKELYGEMPNRPADGGRGRSLGALAWGAHRRACRDRGLAVQADTSFFVSSLEPLAILKAAADKQPGWYVLELPKSEDDFSMARRRPRSDPRLMNGPSDLRRGACFPEKNESNSHVGFAEVKAIGRARRSQLP